ncbi:MAG TPA: helix-turn-helix domain-containing protein [Bauldia sp.]|nr:helix-turn-helix domain-containing protein [Bauldia sp.]
MPRPKTLPDKDVLAAALRLMHRHGPDALTFAALAEATGLSGATLVQRFGSMAGLRQATLLHAWDGLDARTAALAAAVPRTPAGAVRLLARLSEDYGGIEAYVEGLLVLREDLRDPVLRARGAAWRDVLSAALEACFAGVPAAPKGIGLMLAAQWQGALIWWGFDPREPVMRYVEKSLRRFVAAILAARRTPAP